ARERSHGRGRRGRRTHMTGIDWTEAVRDPIAQTTHPRFDDRVAIVAGGGLSGPLGGLGLRIAWLLARGGARVAVFDRDADAAERTVRLIEDAGGAAEALALDMADADAVGAAVDAVVARHGRLDLVADSIGGGGLTGILEASQDEW